MPLGGKITPKRLLANAFILLFTGFVMICAAVILPAIWDVAKEFANTEATHDPRECLTIPNDAQRLTCLEQRVGQTPPQPARGASAPAGIFRKLDEAK